MGMDGDIARHLQKCRQCWPTRPSASLWPDLNSNLGQATKHKQRIHLDLLGPLSATDKSQTFVLCITDQHTCCTQMVSLNDSTADSIATSIFDHWICLFRAPIQIAQFQVAEVRQEILCQLHLHTPGIQIQMLQADDLANLLMARLITTLVDETTINWSLFLFQLMFNYNTSFQQEEQRSMFHQTFKKTPKEPEFPTKDWPYSQTFAEEARYQIKLTKEIMHHHHTTNQIAPTSKPHPRKFCTRQKVLYNENGHLSDHEPNWTGPHEFTSNKGTEHDQAPF
jgi:hypothetical protein